MLAVFALLGATPRATAQTAGEWTIEHYMALSGVYDAAVAERGQLEPESAEWTDATRRALEAGLAVEVYIDRWLDSGTMPPEYVGPAVEARGILLGNLVVYGTVLGRCQQAEREATTLGELATADPELIPSYDAALARIEACYVATGQARPGSDPVAQPEPPPRRERQPATTGQIVGYALIGAGVAAVAGGFAYDASLGGARSEQEDLLDVCTTGAGGCNYLRGNELQDQIEGARIPIAALTIGGAAMAIGGVVAVIVARPGPAEVSAQITPSYQGLRVRVRF